MNRNLFIEALSLEYNKTFGYREYLFNLLNCLNRKLGDLQFQTCTIICKEEDEQHFKAFENLKVKSIRISGRFYKYYVLNRLDHIIKISPNDIVLFTNNYSSLRKYCKFVLVIHDLLYLRKDYCPDFLFRFQRHLFIPRSVRIADKIVAISKFVKDDIVDAFNVDGTKVDVIHNYFRFDKYEDISDTVFSPSVNDSISPLSYFVVVSSNNPHKNTITILKAYAKYLKQSEKKTKLVVIGTFPQEFVEFCQENIVDYNQYIHRLYNISNKDLGRLYQKAVAYISSTLFEGLGMPIVEAMYFNTPIVLSDIQVLHETSNNNGFYFDPLNENQLCSILLSFDRSNTRPNYRNIVLDLYSERNTVDKYVEVLNKF